MAGMRAPAMSAAVEDVLPVVREHADETDRGRRLAAPVVEAFVDTGLFRIGVPQALGGAELDPMTFVQVGERVAAIDGSSAWCLMIAASTGITAGLLAEADAKDLFGDPRAVAAGVVAPNGRAERVDGGYRLTGRWSFASGCQHSTTVAVGAMVDGRPGPPRMLFVPTHAVTIHDTWDVVGLSGTGSHDVTVDGATVPEGWSLVLGAAPHAGAAGGSLYRFPVFGLIASMLAAVSIGIARAAVDDLVDLAGGKKPAGSRRSLAERATAQAEVAKTAALVDGARSMLLDALADAWATVEAGDAASVDQRARIRLAATNAVRSAAAATAAMYDLAGGSAVYRRGPLERRFRDAHVITQHAMVGPATYELVGRIRLGLDTETFTL